MRSRLVILAALAACGGGHGTIDAGPGDAPPPAAPAIVSTAPSDGTGNVPTGSLVTIQFSKAMDTASVAFAIDPPVTFDAPSWDDVGARVVLAPSTPLAAATSYTVMVTGSDRTGMALAGTTSFGFTTAAVAPVEPPSVTDFLPPTAASGPITFDFSKPMDPRTVVVTATPDHLLGAPVWSSGLRALSFDNSGLDWLASTVVSVTITGSDFDGNPLAGTTTFSFQTAGPPPVVPHVSTTWPANGATGVRPNTRFSITFDQPMDTAATGASFGISPFVACTQLNPLRPPIWIDESHTVVCRGGLAPSTTYTVTMWGATQADAQYRATSQAGVVLPATYSFSFTTGPAVTDTVAPAITALDPPANATGVALGHHVIDVTFGEDMDPTSGGVSVTGATLRAVSWSISRRILQLDLTTDLPAGQTISYTLTGFRDVAGNAMATTTESFTAITDRSVEAAGDPARDGTIRQPGGLESDSLDVVVGVAGSGASASNARGFLSFALPDAVLAPGATVVRAYLVFAQPSASLEPLTDDEPVRFLDVSLGSDLDATDYDGALLGCAEADDTIDQSTVGMHAVDVTAKVACDVTRGSHADFRVQLSRELADGATAATADLGAGESATPPTLWIEYQGGAP